MKILITSPSFDAANNVSGISTYAAALIRNSGGEFTHFTAGKKDNERSRIGWAVRQARLPVRFLSAIRREKPEVIHINTAMETRAIIRDTTLAAIAKFAKTPAIVHIHGGRYSREPITNKAVARVFRQMLGYAKKVIVLGEPEHRAVLEYVERADIEMLSNAIDVSEIPGSEQANVLPVMLFFGRIDASKGLEHIAEACATLAGQGFRFQFRCFGAGPETDDFNALMRIALRGDYEYGGVVAGNEKWKVLAGADIFLLPSHYEGMPIALLEAMAAGCIPVVSDVGSIPEAVEDGYNGYLVKPGDLVQLIGRLKMLLSDRTLWPALRENARQTVRERFEISGHIRELERIYAETADRK